MNMHLGPHFQQALGQTPANPSPRPCNQHSLAVHLWNGHGLLTDSFLFRDGQGKLKT